MGLLVVRCVRQIPPRSGAASTQRHVAAERAVTRITLYWISLCIRLELARAPNGTATSAIKRNCRAAGPSALSRPVVLGPKPGSRRAALLGRRAAFLGKLSKERLRILQVGSFEAFGEPVVHRREQVVSLPPLAPIGPEPGKIAGGSKLEDA
jgi:hypothetical protein